MRVAWPIRPPPLLFIHNASMLLFHSPMHSYADESMGNVYTVVKPPWWGTMYDVRYSSWHSSLDIAVPCLSEQVMRGEYWAGMMGTPLRQVLSESLRSLSCLMRSKAFWTSKAADEPWLIISYHYRHVDYGYEDTMINNLLLLSACRLCIWRWLLIFLACQWFVTVLINPHSSFQLCSSLLACALLCWSQALSQ